jgi:type IV pilus assembly protein PilW
MRALTARHRQAGFTLVELSVSVLIGLFLLGGLATLVQNNKRAFASQNQLSQLQDSERLAMQMMTDVIQASGYFPNPAINYATQPGIFPAAGTLALGQAMTGTYGGGTAPGDTITVRYTTAPGDTILNCGGTSNISGANAQYINVFSVNASGQLICTLTINSVVQPAIPLVGTGTVGTNQQISVQNLTILYGVSTSGNTNVDTYMNATQVAANSDWNNVISVLVQLTFAIPTFAGGGNTTQLTSATTASSSTTAPSGTVTIQRVIGVMNKAGVQS